ncbi:peptidase S41 [Porphyrobacter algicida]|uniref:Peptidase S41 n=1 Tax=Qipengyuania algicida TaxID=1836209 RepID=A0A845ASA5_9SPHN|nr:S41 family peptidase [Qipengyuania algicida]MXP29768.1 peptidase S41 [Qipengyuania algicida]
MSLGRSIMSSVLALSLVACGGGGTSSGASSSTGGTSGGGISPTDCSFSAREQWVRDTINEWYLFPDKLNLNADPASFTNLQDYINALVAPSVTPPDGTGTGPLRHGGLTYITSIAEENALIQNGSNAGFGIRLSYNTASNRVFVVEAFESAPAYAAGIDRGTELLAIDGTSVSSLMSSGGPYAVIDALGPNNTGVSRSLTFADPDGAQHTATIAKADYSLDPISNRYGVKILDDGVEKVGYINLRTFIIEDAENQLRTAFQQFQSAGITKVILDLRYNGGGLVSVAEVLGDLMAKDKVGQVFSTTQFRSSQSTNDTTDYFVAEPNAIAATKIAVIGTGGTASASELVANAFIPYLKDNIALIGSNTFGKPVGQSAFDRSACDDRLRVIAFRTVNADGNGDYYGGLASVMPATCSASDDYLKPLGDPTEASIKTALDYLAGRSCTPITGTSGQTAQSVQPRDNLLRSHSGSSLDHDSPGIY